MFYSHEILTSRKYGVATVWLVATLGSTRPGTSKKINRKAILSVDIHRACDTVIEPSVPMALRLQSNLLIGISRVYSQQVSYVLLDTEKIREGIRGLSKSLNKNGANIDLDNLGEGKGRRDNLLLGDDPAFDPDMALPALDFDWDFEGPGNVGKGDSQSLSPFAKRASASSSAGGSVIHLNFPSPSSAGGAGFNAFNDPFAKSSARKSGIGLGREEGEEELLFEDDGDLGFEFDEHGIMRDLSVQEIQARRALSRSSVVGTAEERVRKEHEDGRALLGQDEDWNMNLGEEDGLMILDDDNAEPFPARPIQQPERELSPSHQTTSTESAEAPQRARRQAKTRTKKAIKADESNAITFKNSDLADWQANYAAKQQRLSAAKHVKDAGHLAKKNAIGFVYGMGINGVGAGIGSQTVALNIKSPLAMFSGDALLSKFLGKPLSTSTIPAKRTSPNVNEDAANKRLHSSSPGIGRAPHPDEEPQFNFGGEENPMNPNLEEDPEIGRDAPSALPEYPSSALMPWNFSTSAHSHHPASSSLHLGGHRASSLGIGPSKRLTSASPLIGRGNNLPGELERFSSQLELSQFANDEDGNIQYGRSDSFHSGNNFDHRSSTQEFEIFGQAANVDTQTAGGSQWISNALATETENFYEFVSNSISDKFGEEGEDNWMGFGELFDEQKNSRMVAAQAFYHLLCLGTMRGRVGIRQEEGEKGVDGLGGEIWICVL